MNIEYVENQKENEILNKIYKIFQKYFKNQTPLKNLNDNKEIQGPKKALIKRIINKNKNKVFLTDEELKFLYEKYDIKSGQLEENGFLYRNINISKISGEDNKILTSDWKESEFYNQINNKKILLFFIKKSKNSSKKHNYFHDFFVINFDNKTKKNAEKVYNETKKQFNSNKKIIINSENGKQKKHNIFINESDNLDFYVSDNSKSKKYKTISNEILKEQAFWLSKKYIKNSYDSFVKNESKKYNSFKLKDGKNINKKEKFIFSVLSEEEIKSSEIFLKLSKKHKIIIKEIEYNKFINECQIFHEQKKENKKNVFLLSGYKVNNKKIILCFSLSSKVNSFSFLKNVKYLEKISKYENYIKYELILKGKKSIKFFDFFVSNYSYFDEDKFETEFVFKNRKKLISEIIPEINKEMKEKIRRKNKQNCYMNHNWKIKNEIGYKCPIIKVDKNFLINENLNYTDIHHFIPKKYFIKKFKEGVLSSLDPDIVHSTINLIPLCKTCHNAIHKGKGNEKLVKMIFHSIILRFKEENKIEKFKKFLKDNLKTDLKKLLNFYKGSNN